MRYIHGPDAPFLRSGGTMRPPMFLAAALLLVPSVSPAQQLDG
jgi:hypothetical protein